MPHRHQESQRIRFILIRERNTLVGECALDCDFTGVSFAGDMSFDSAHGDALIRDLLFLAKRRQRREKASIDMSSVYAKMSPHFLKIDASKAVCEALHLLKPFAEQQESHAAPTIAGILKPLHTTRHLCSRTTRPAAMGSQIKG
jgi:signal transduction histidine kinase